MKNYLEEFVLKSGMKLTMSRYGCIEVACLAWLDLLKVRVIETKWDATKLCSLGKLWKPSEQWRGTLWKKQNNQCLVYLRNFWTSYQCWELLKLVGMSWNVASCMRIVVNRPWWNGLAPFGYWCMFVGLLVRCRSWWLLWHGLCRVCNS